ncbi:hypothetical protein PSYG_00018 [Psychrobacter phage pOW20-A]|uniref:CI-like repressor n=1 Tax=Psychrobacter phage pOW20-A TaxID=754048 RepID=UPI0002C182E6|nr:CI-like repressor [Psychrobacter phage pOW20-A]AGH57479.1 hypothetical protein PSYG_00018 [Psychrobacter phage pOW20-A]
MREFTGIETVRRENTKRLIKENKLTRSQFSEQSGIHYALLGHYIGKNPTKAIGDEIARKIEGFFGKPENYLDHEHDKQLSLVDNIHSSNAVRITSDTKGLIEINIYNTYAQNEQGLCEFSEIQGVRNFQPSFFVDKGINSDNFRLINAHNGSMSPFINDGDDVGIDISRTSIDDGSIYAILLDGVSMFKQVFVEAGGDIRLHSFNPNYPDKIVSSDKLGSLVIVGKQVYRAG